MGKFSFILANALGLLLMGCHDNSKAQAEQFAVMQARLDEQERQNHLLQAQAKEKEEQRVREEELRKADERAWAEQNAHKTANTKTKQPNQPETPTNPPKSTQTTKSEPKPKPTTVKFTEKPARYPATIVTSSGYGELSLRGEPSVKGVQVTTVYDGAEVWVVTETNRCETISGVRGCWHKVSVDGVKGYMFSGYLQRELMSQAQKQSMYQNHDEHDGEYDMNYQ